MMLRKMSSLGRTGAPVAINRYSRFKEVEVTYKVATDDGEVLFEKSIVITADNVGDENQLADEAYALWYSLEDDDNSDVYRYFNGKRVNGYRLEACRLCSTLFFVRDHHGTKHCSPECSDNAKTSKQAANRKAVRQAARVERPCDHCNEPFTPKRTDAKFCCAKCRVYAKRKRDQAK